MTKIVLGFPCMGKTYFAKNNDKAIDLESSEYFFIKDDRFENSEQWKGLKDRKFNPTGLQDYLKAIKDAVDSGAYDYVFTSQSPEVVKGIINLGYQPIFVKPHGTELSDVEFIKRAKNRGNNDD